MLVFISILELGSGKLGGGCCGEAEAETRLHDRFGGSVVLFFYLFSRVSPLLTGYAIWVA